MTHWYSAGEHCRTDTGRECVILTTKDWGVFGLGFQELLVLELGTEQRFWIFAGECTPVFEPRIVARGPFPRLVWSQGQHV